MGNIAANMITSNTIRDWMISGYSLVVFTTAAILAAFFSLKSRSFRRVANGEPLVLIHKGIILRNNLAKSRVNLDVLMMLLREKGYFSYGDIDYAILEPTGNLSILPIPQFQTASKGDLAVGPDLDDKGGGPFIELIVDGELDFDKLREIKVKESWVLEQITKLGGEGLQDVTYFAMNHEGKVLADLNRRKNSRADENRI
jgi:uncharacterized membrane protein YcaP (DUF421 family)